LDKCIPGEDSFSLKYVSFTGRSGRPGRAAGLHPGQVKASSPAAGDPLPDQSEKSEFIPWVLRRAGLDPDGYRVRPILRRLPACLRALHADTETHAVQLIEKKPELLSVAVGSLLIGVTEFFRDPDVFQIIRTEVIPQLAACGRPLRVWSAGCSNGAELYSIAILLAQAGLLEGSYLLGTDFRFDALELARSAVYDANQVKNIQLPDQCVYFTRAGKNYRPIEQLRRNIQWRIADLVQGVEQGPWDLILWRNMAIYLTPETIEPIWRGLASALTPGGALIVGQAEKPPASLSMVSLGRCIYGSCSPILNGPLFRETSD
jgi:chemotaxis protein methyltransferase CheR